MLALISHTPPASGSSEPDINGVRVGIASTGLALWIHCFGACSRTRFYSDGGGGGGSKHIARAVRAKDSEKASPVLVMFFVSVRYGALCLEFPTAARARSYQAPRFNY